MNGVPEDELLSGISESDLSLTATSPAEASVMSCPTVRAAGAVLWRSDVDGHTEVAVVHRPRYDDWSLPKGKLDVGETIPLAAVREVAEETGFSCVLSRFLRQVRYPVPTRDGGHAAKVVDYYCAQAREGAFTPGDEVDELRWMSVENARRQLSYPHDAGVLDAFGEVPTHVKTLMLVRHAKAGSRSDWNGDDDLRPLSTGGQRQQAALHAFLPLFGPQRVHSAPRLRCEQTVQPVATDLGVSVESEPLLSEEGYWPQPQAAIDRLLRIASLPGTAVVCSQGGVIPDLVARLAGTAGIDAGQTDLGEVPSKKGSVWTLTFRCAPRTDNGTGPALRLATADYLADPLP